MRVLIVHTHPVQYLAPLFRRYASDPLIDLTVAYCEVATEGQGLFDDDFRLVTDWKIDLLGGYRHVALQGRLPIRYAKPAVSKLIRKGRFDIVVSYGYNHPTSWFSFFAAKSVGTPWVFVGDNFTIENQRGRRWPGKRTFLRCIGGIADGIIAQSNRSHGFYRQFAERVALVPHAVEVSRFANANLASVEGLRESTETVFLFVGKLIGRKRVADAIDAIKDVPDSTLWIVGSGEEEPAVRAQAARLGDRVKFLGFRDQTEMPAIYAACDVLVLPSSIETFGLVVSEAAAAGRPSIVSDACGVAGSVVIDGVTGLVFPVGNVARLHEAMLQMRDPELRKRLQENLRERLKEWSPDANARAFVAACSRLARFDS